MIHISGIAKLSLVALLVSSPGFVKGLDRPPDAPSLNASTVMQPPQKKNFNTCLESAQSDLLFSKQELDGKLWENKLTSSQVMRRKALSENLFYNKRLICAARYS